MAIQEYHFLTHETDRLESILSDIATSTCDMDLSKILNEVRARAPDILKQFNNFESEISRFCNDFNSDGIMRIKNVPIRSDQNVITWSNVTTLLFGELIGSVTKYKEEGDFLMKIARVPNAAGRKPGHSNSIEFKPHTDLSYVAAPPEFMLLHGISFPKKPCTSIIFCSLNRILEELSKLEFGESDLMILQQPLFKFDIADHYRGDPIEHKAIFSNLENEKRMIRFRSDTVSTDDPAACKALERLNRAIDSTRIYKDFNEGDMYLLANWRTLHGRPQLNSSESRIINRAYLIR